VEQAAANPLLDEIEALQDQVLADLDQLNRQIETVLKVQLTTEAGEGAGPANESSANESSANESSANESSANESSADDSAGKLIRYDLPMVIQPPCLHLTAFLPVRIAG
jgi:hypothetical protein